MNPFTVRADPGWPVADAPFVFGKAFRADFKTAGAAPAKGLFFFAAVAGVAICTTTAAFSWWFVSHVVGIQVEERRIL